MLQCYSESAMAKVQCYSATGSLCNVTVSKCYNVVQRLLQYHSVKVLQHALVVQRLLRCYSVKVLQLAAVVQRLLRCYSVKVLQHAAVVQRMSDDHSRID